MTGLLVLSAAIAFPPPETAKLDLKDGDRIVWLGGTHVEREQKYGYWETALHAAFPKVNFTLRNLGWSGDTVYGDSRAGFDTPKEGFKRLVDQTLALKPTVILISYGQNESYDGEAGLPRFEKGLETLLDALKPAKARPIFVLPVPISIDPSKSDGASELQSYATAVRTFAEKRNDFIVDVGSEIKKMRGNLLVAPLPPITDNGIHFNETGYRLSALAFASAFGYSPWNVTTDEYIKRSNRNEEQLRRTVVAKNQLFFYRWRPQNETYLTGFRKREQGQNAKEVAEFDPLVEKAEKEIERLKKDLFK